MLGNHYQRAVQTLKRHLEKPERVFATIAATFGLVMAFLLPPFMAPDENVHFYRAYQIGSGQLVSQTIDGVATGGYVPEGREGRFFEPLDLSKNTFMAFPASAAYSPVNYIPQAIGIDIGRLIHPSVGVMSIFGRLFNLAAYILLIFIAIRIAPLGRWVYVVAALLPIAIQQAASLSSDVMNIGLTFIAIACMHRLFLQKDLRLTRRHFWWALLLAAGIGLTKPTNILLLLPLIFIPKSLFVNGWRKLGFVLAVGGTAIATLLGWYLVTKLLNYVTHWGLEGADPSLQLQYIIEQPINFLVVFLKTFVFEGFHSLPTVEFHLISFVGIFSLILYKLPLYLVILAYAVLLLALLYKDDGGLKIAPRLVWTQIASFGGSIFAIGLALYLTWTPVGTTQIWGVQGRYFICLVPLLIPIFALLGNWIKISFDKPYRMGAIVVVISIINLGAMVLLTDRWF